MVSNTPSTPKAAASIAPQPGAWRHPQFAEIARRQNASTFTDQNVRQVAYNVGGLLVLWLAEKLVQAYIPSIFHLTRPLRPYSGYAYALLRVIFIYNIIVALLPLVRPKDDLADIPLTPAQRKLLDLPASETPPTPGSAYSTPPRFTKSASPLNSSLSSSYSPSPAMGRDQSGTPGRGSPYSPNASPLLHKAIGGANARRTSYGSPSPLGQSTQKLWMDAPSTPSPSGGKGVSVGLNNKWLYEKGRGSPGSASMFS